MKTTKYRKLATARTVEQIEKYVNDYFYSTDYRVHPETLEITNAVKTPPANIFVMPYRGGFLFGRRNP